MKTRILIVALLVCCAVVKSVAQLLTPLPNKEEMKKLSAWVGQWKGEGSMQMGPGEPKKSSVEERIEMKLDGMIMVVEGLGKAIDPSTQKEIVIHQAYGVLSYDPVNRDCR